MDTKKQRQCRRDGNTRSEQLLMVPTESLTNRQQLLGELFSGSECRRPGWFLDMKYQTCFCVVHFMSMLSVHLPILYMVCVRFVRTVPLWKKGVFCFDCFNAGPSTTPVGSWSPKEKPRRVLHSYGPSPHRLHLLL